jgi:hypothetical protein
MKKLPKRFILLLLIIMLMKIFGFISTGEAVNAIFLAFILREVEQTNIFLK